MVLNAQTNTPDLADLWPVKLQGHHSWVQKFWGHIDEWKWKVSKFSESFTKLSWLDVQIQSLESSAYFGEVQFFNSIHYPRGVQQCGILTNKVSPQNTWIRPPNVVSHLETPKDVHQGPEFGPSALLQLGPFFNPCRNAALRGILAQLEMTPDKNFQSVTIASSLCDFIIPCCKAWEEHGLTRQPYAFKTKIHYGHLSLEPARSGG